MYMYIITYALYILCVYTASQPEGVGRERAAREGAGVLCVLLLLLLLILLLLSLCVLLQLLLLLLLLRLLLLLLS